MYLYQNLNGHSSTIDGYKYALIDSLVSVGLNISQISLRHSCSEKFVGGSFMYNGKIKRLVLEINFGDDRYLFYVDLIFVDETFKNLGDLGLG